MLDYSPFIRDLLTAMAVCAALGAVAGLALYALVRRLER